MLPTSVSVTEEKDHRATIAIEPCFPGYGTTLGNALRRVLLSSIPGASVTSIKIKGVTHEFTTLPNVKEDMVELILRLKLLRFRVHGTEKTTATISVSGDKKVTGKDVKTSSDCEVVNPTVHVLTTTSKDASFEAELTIETGLGYVPVENREKENTDVSAIMVDAVYTPIKNVNFTTEHVRIGQMTNYDKLVLDITTDGTMTPVEAFAQASKILQDHFSYLVEQAAVSDEKPAKKASAMEDIEEQSEDMES